MFDISNKYKFTSGFKKMKIETYINNNIKDWSSWIFLYTTFFIFFLFTCTTLLLVIETYYLSWGINPILGFHELKGTFDWFITVILCFMINSFLSHIGSSRLPDLHQGVTAPVHLQEAIPLQIQPHPPRLTAAPFHLQPN